MVSTTTIELYCDDGNGWKEEKVRRLSWKPLDRAALKYLDKQLQLAQNGNKWLLAVCHCPRCQLQLSGCLAVWLSGYLAVRVVVEHVSERLLFDVANKVGPLSK